MDSSLIANFPVLVPRIDPNWNASDPGDQVKRMRSVLQEKCGRSDYRSLSSDQEPSFRLSHWPRAAVVVDRRGQWATEHVPVLVLDRTATTLHSEMVDQGEMRHLFRVLEAPPLDRRR